ncbi:prostaglandin E synthase 3-like protein [Syncephalis plumigaleata]|nr:prostaglandin E synthase 3-like protein [Syncephalis plumigaleata]
MTTTIRHPEVLWAQRTETLLVTINLRDIKNEKVTLESNRLTFSGESDGTEYAFDIELYDEVVPEESKQAKTGMNLHMIIKKKVDDQPYWPRLQKEKIKLPYLRTDFSRWVDEDEQHEQAAGEGGMQGFPGMEGMDFSQFQGAGGDMDFNAMMGGGADFEEEEDDEEEEGDSNESK